MKLRDIFLQMPEEALEHLARERLSQVTDIRLPQTVLVDELAEVLGSSAYVSTHVGLRHPPCFAILDLLMNAPDHTLPTEGFRQKVQDATERMVSLANRSPIFPKPKNYNLYLKMLYEAWDYEQDINPSEANLLRVLREELGISLMEHFVIEHHSLLHRFWRNEQAYEEERNHLRGAGILFAIENGYVLPEETVVLIRRAWGTELSEQQFRRLLDALSNEDLRRILEAEGLNVSGTAEEKKSRILENYVLPRGALASLRIDSLRESARRLGCRANGAKEEVIENIIDWLDNDEDLKAQATAETAATEEKKISVSEPRELSNETFADLLGRLTNDSLYDILSRLTDLRKSGTKEERVKRLLESPFSEHTILMKLNNEALHDLCRQLGLSPYGPKEEKIARLVEAYRNFTPQSRMITPDLSPPSKPESEPAVPFQTAASQLLRLASVRAEFPFLNEPEQIVLSYLIDFKSLTDPELEKLVQRFALPWILPKAQMADLVKTLRAQGRNIIHVRGLGDHNIYELAS